MSDDDIFADTDCQSTALYGIEPIGIGTPYVESLMGYIMRLAAAHMVGTSDLMHHIITAAYTSHAAQIGKLNASIREINGMSEYASAMVNALEQLTGQEGLSLLTMLPFKGLFSNYLLTSPDAGYCAYCFREQREAGRPAYIQLLWHLNPFKYCVEHRSRLNQQCPYCEYYRPTLNSVPGYCCRCGEWLGSLDDYKGPSKNEDGPKYDFPHRLLARSKEFDETKPIPTFPSLMKYLVGNRVRIKNNGGMARVIQIKSSTIESWIAGDRRPTMITVLILARQFGIDPMDIIATDGEEMLRRDQGVIASGNLLDKLLEPTDWGRMRYLLEDVANGKASVMSTQDIARVYKCDPKEILEKYPELSTAVEKRYYKKYPLIGFNK